MKPLNADLVHRVESLPPIPNPVERPTVSVPFAGLYYGLNRDSAYRAAKRGDIPTIHVGRRILVPTAALRKALGIDGADAA